MLRCALVQDIDIILDNQFLADPVLFVYDQEHSTYECKLGVDDKPGFGVKNASYLFLE